MRPTQQTAPAVTGAANGEPDKASQSLSVIPGGRMGKEQEPGAALATLDEYEARGGYNVLHPVVQVIDGGAISPVLYESVSLVRINPSAGDTYNDYRYANEGQGLYALSGLALGKIAAAAGVKWIPDLCRVEERTRSADGHLYIR